jgi:hypothetical protein
LLLAHASFSFRSGRPAQDREPIRAATMSAALRRSARPARRTRRRDRRLSAAQSAVRFGPLRVCVVLPGRPARRQVDTRDGTGSKLALASIERTSPIDSPTVCARADPCWTLLRMWAALQRRTARVSLVPGTRRLWRAAARSRVGRAAAVSAEARPRTALGRKQLPRRHGGERRNVARTSRGRLRSPRRTGSLQSRARSPAGSEAPSESTSPKGRPTRCSASPVGQKRSKQPVIAPRPRSSTSFVA